MEGSGEGGGFVGDFIKGVGKTAIEGVKAIAKTSVAAGSEALPTAAPMVAESTLNPAVGEAFSIARGSAIVTAGEVKDQVVKDFKEVFDITDNPKQPESNEVIFRANPKILFNPSRMMQRSVAPDAIRMNSAEAYGSA